MDKLTGGNVLDYSIPKQVAGQLSVMCLPYFDCGEFKSFMKEIGLQEKDIIFEGEFLLDPLVVSKYLSELVFERDKIHEDYYKKPQEMYLRMQSYKPPSSGWLFARTVPDALKKQVIDECSGKGDAPSLKTLVDIVNKHFS